ncbi:MAG: hypothetical protein KatS3mg109_0170 [Pirellulaceae bacterium]|nr:MAG: hypothetical protein KatS3mg109_0170 [Pirellulaceae bacterium]
MLVAEVGPWDGGIKTERSLTEWRRSGERSRPLAGVSPPVSGGFGGCDLRGKNTKQNSCGPVVRRSPPYAEFSRHRATPGSSRIPVFF